MKKLCYALLAVFVMSLTPSLAQSGKIPANVKKAFISAHPNAEHTKWDKEKDGYEASFTAGGKQMSVEYDKAGKLVATETSIAFEALPEPVRTYLDTHHKGEKVKESALIVAADGTKTYETEVKGKDLLFDAEGNLKK